MNLPQSMTSYATFACPSCGQGVPATVPQGMQFPCPYCKNTVTSPGSSITPEQMQANMQWAMQHGAAAAAQSALAYEQQQNPDAAHFAPGADTIVAIAPDGRRLLIGAQVQADRTWMLRAIDLSTREVAWEALHGATWSFAPERRHIAVRGGRVYVAFNGLLSSIDLATGQRAWGSTLFDHVETDSDLMYQPDEMLLFDAAPGAPASVVVICTTNGSVVGYDRDSGQCVWQLAFDDSAKMSPLPGVGVVVRSSDGSTIVGMNGAAIAQFPAGGKPSYGEAVAYAGKVVVKHDGDEGNGVAIIDGATGQLVASRIVQDVGEDPAPLCIAGKAVCVVNAGKPGQYQIVDPGKPQAQPGFFKKMFGGRPGGEHLEVGIPNMGIVALRACGTLAVMQLRGWDGLDARRIVAIDVATGQRRFDSGQLAYEPSNMEGAQVQANDQMFVYVTSPSNDDDDCELRAVAATGQAVWAAKVGHWNHHFIAGNVVVVYAYGGVQLLDLASGQPVASYP